ncbi:DUF2493 domain-containing protein [uncultured Arcobacter sp.]|uniref:DUF2493 domain-containing protein n=1 Tax=uncultured Arcobacter sp. TaxID=165434 RepID=UPI00263888C3|nr:DUF2493 domain-containing protein [uncultured Arcobacter sp.]
MKVGVIGSRDFDCEDFIFECLDYMFDIENISYIVSGGARGVDSIAEKYAKQRGIETIIFKAEWDKYGKSAGYKRNKLIVDECDIVVAFWDYQSKGTKHSIDLCKKSGTQYIIIDTRDGTEDDII